MFDIFSVSIHILRIAHLSAETVGTGFFEHLRQAGSLDLKTSETKRQKELF